MTAVAGPSAQPAPSSAGEGEIAATITQAAATGEPLLICGNATKLGMLRPVQAARRVSTAGLTGITLYSPKELVISARAGTPLAELEQTLAANGQHLIAEPPDLTALLATADPQPSTPPQTIGGIIAANISGPRRVAWGAMRDHVLGIRAINGAGESIHSGGRVLKNVTGLDLCKLLTGSHGTLAVITEVTLKILPTPETTASLVLPGLDAEQAVAALSAGLGSPYGVSAAAWLPDASLVPALTPVLTPTGGPSKTSATLLRIEDFAPSVAYRTARLRTDLAVFATADILDDATSKSVWRAVGDALPLPRTATDAIWRVSVRPSAGPAVLRAVAPAGVRGFLDWGGGLVWLAGPADAATHLAVEHAARAASGTWTLLRAPDALRVAVDVIPPEPAPLARITQRVKGAFDPRGVLNPGRFYAGL